MLKIVYLFLFGLLPCLAMAQKDSAVYLRFPTIPSFQMINLADSSRFTKDSLDKKKATVFIIFNPFCDHCKHETEDLTANIDLFKQAQIIMASPVDYGYLKKFYDDYKIARYPNIIMGRDPGNFLGTFFNVQSIPSVYVYDKKGKFIASFERPESVKKIAGIL